MFNQLFTRPVVVARYCAAPLPKERSAFLHHLTGQGMSHSYVKKTAALLLVITDMLRLGVHSDRMISVSEIEEAANRWANRHEKRKSHNPRCWSKEWFSSIATRWLESIGRLEQQDGPLGRFESLIAEFDDYMLNERGLSYATRKGRCWSINRCLSHLDMIGDSLTDLSITNVDSLFQLLGEKCGYSRASLQKFAGDLRAFFRFGAIRGWCSKGLAEAIKSPRVYSLDSLPSGPSWEDVKRLLALTEGDSPMDIRDRAILMLLAMYGLRAGEVQRLRLEDFDWEGELLTVRCSKTLKGRIYPLSRPVGDAVLRYITQVRPRTGHREVFLSLRGPIQPLAMLWPIVAKRLRRIGVTTIHHGPHALRHACATHLLAEGMSLKQIGDHLGHRDPDATRIYAKVDIIGLRQVADMDMGGLL